MKRAMRKTFLTHSDDDPDKFHQKIKNKLQMSENELNQY